ncbi:hypothetical protein DFJ74DRAFT_711947 [Hyaloraphidium curvatum]|nr:hypothetical protein DFJ74DRAFT_711947 [Hyaloraphidium curvatum]
MASSAAAEWVPVWDDNYKAYYYYNRSTKETTWTPPDGVEVPAADESDASESASEGGSGDEEAPQPPSLKRKAASERSSEGGREDSPEQPAGSPPPDDPPRKRARTPPPDPAAPSLPSYAKFYAGVAAASQPAPVSDPASGRFQYAPRPAAEGDADTSALDSLFARIDEAKEVLDRIAPPEEGRRGDPDEAERLREEVLKLDAAAALAPPEEEEAPSLPADEYRAVGFFDAKTGKFRRPDVDARVADPRDYFHDANKAVRQMNFYFDYEQFAEERSRDRQEALLNPEGPKKLTKKQIEEYKRKKEEKKKRRHIAEYGIESDIY